jgi:hypothetical protein
MEKVDSFKCGVYSLRRKENDPKIVRVIRTKKDYDYYKNKLKYAYIEFLREVTA